MAFSPGQRHAHDHGRVLHIIAVAKTLALEKFSFKDLKDIEEVYCAPVGTELHKRFQEVLERGSDHGDYAPRVDGLPLPEGRKLQLAAEHRSIMEGHFAKGLLAFNTKAVARSKA